ncbi:nuclear transport factor 2 family protein [Mucilaginibacter robiniae]|uniref:Nuclear transport factor 2 family protein n=1 Tax=Mucilaginibacter robiniae TaxID=2728022 RepID=A0A7L5DXZ7_9SPHI|nr:nuclear transport factor 2 family protein [Mucilaginibacter robiniae]QJD95641.1 nuclear transport factor 2 family protein [Mucilaginibacter robiniae]
MKNYVLSCFLLLISCFCFAQDRQAILKVLETQRQAWNRGDVEDFMQGYWKSDSLMFVGTGAPTYGWQNTLAHYKKVYPGKAAMGQLTFHILKVQLLDATNAFVMGGWHLKREKDEPGGYFTLWFRKIKGQWKIVVDHTS